MKWGAPAWLTDATRAGTTIRAGYMDGAALPGRLYVHCQTSLIEDLRARFGELVVTEGARALHLPQAPDPTGPVRAAIAMALTYRQRKAPRRM